MRRLLAVLLVMTLWLGVVPPASADIGGLVPCSESPKFQERAAKARNTTGDPESGRKRFEVYSKALCGAEDGLPRIIAGGPLSRAGDFLIPGLFWIYIMGAIGNASRNYQIANRKKNTKNPAMGEVVIDVPLAISSTISAFAWPLTAFRELTTGQLTVPDSDITVAPR
jgi:photosystem I subunit 3